MNLKTDLRNELMNQLQEISKMQVGTEEYKIAVEGFTKLMDRLIELDKMTEKQKDEVNALLMEYEYKQKQLEEEVKNRKVQNWLTVVSLVSNIGLIVWGSLYAWAKEDNGNMITTLPGRKFMDRLFNFKK